MMKGLLAYNSRFPAQNSSPFSMSHPHPAGSDDPIDNPVGKSSGKIIIQGVTQAGRAFRPSDWAERLCGIMCAFGGDQQLRYSPYVQPVMMDGVRCVVVEPSLAQVEPRAYRFLFDFARDNDLVVIDPSAPPSDDFCPVPDNMLDKLAEDARRMLPERE